MSTRWQNRAACAHTPTELWFGRGQDEPVSASYRRRCRAMEICEHCPVRLECLAEELTNPRFDQHGIRGGLTAIARQRLLGRWRSEGRIPPRVPVGDTAVIRQLLVADDDLP